MEYTFDQFFSLQAGEAPSQNKWTGCFLPAWSMDHQRFRDLDECREMIILKTREKKFWNLDGTISHDSIPKLEVQSKNYRLLAFYFPGLPRNITYLEGHYLAREEWKHIIRIHERMHAFHHCNVMECYNEEGLRMADQQSVKETTWKGFSNVSPVYLEFLAQLFTFKSVQGSFLEKYFIELSQNQPSIYQTWILGKDLSFEKVFQLFESIRSGAGSGIPFLDQYAGLYNNKLDSSAQNEEGAKCFEDNLLLFEKAFFVKTKQLGVNDLDEARIDEGLKEAMDQLW